MKTLNDLHNGQKEPWQRTYSQNLRLRREGRFGEKGEPIPGIRTAATLARKARSKASRLTRDQQRAEMREKVKEQATALARSVQGAEL